MLTTTEDSRVKACGHEMVTCGLLAVCAGDLKTAVFQGALEVF